MSGESDAASVVESGRLWEEFCDALKDAGKIVACDLAGDPLDRAEGYRYLTRLTRLALEKFLEHADPLAPTFYRLSHETAKIGCDNPDSFYQNAAIDGSCEYRLYGTRGTIAYLGIGAYYGHYGSSARSGCSDYLESTRMKVGPDGRLEIILSARPHPGNWIRLEPDSSMLIVRQNFLDRSTETIADLKLERIGADGPPSPLTSERLVAGLRGAGSYVAGTARLFADWARAFRTRPNRMLALDPKVTGGAHGDPNIFFYMGWWQLAPNEALVIEATPPECEYWNFQLNNVWMESLDYRYLPVSTNKHTTRYRSDGSFRIVISAENRGFANWMDTGSHQRGTMGLRWIKAKDHPQPSARVALLSELEPD
ncbi:MAG TPA: DUF1214 domain-containing protein [Candidatus Limnocylindrales bacterium]|nr:DUF1214 domain-containing protein [Candidatus Limnocylindrales bacterium]